MKPNYERGWRERGEEITRLQRKIDDLAAQLSTAHENNRGLYAERDRWRANAMSAFAALEDTRRMLTATTADPMAESLERASAINRQYDEEFGRDTRKRKQLPRRRRKA